MKHPRTGPIELRLTVAALAAAVALIGEARPASAQTPAPSAATQAASQAQKPHRIMVTSPAMKTTEAMARDYTPDGRNVSPPLAWTDLPAGTKELAVVCADFGAGNPPPWVHWIIYKIPPTATGLPEGVPFDASVPMPKEIAGAVQGLNGWRKAIYRGPAPPPGKAHIYYFTVYALDAPINVKSSQPPLTRAELLQAIDGHIIGQGEIVPVYERKAAPARSGGGQ
jgi:Raf kinase inhibitor-like YbhB/YbcL family protein